MPNLKVLLPCEAIIQDKDTNLTSLISIMDQITPAGIPFILSKLDVFMLFEKLEGDKDKQEISIVIKINEIDLFSRKLKFDFQKKKKVKVNLHLRGFPINQIGVLHICVYIEEELLNCYDVNIIAPPIPEMKVT